MEKFDVAVIGGGPGGYVAAIRAAQRGANVALVEVGDLGGTCLNRGCIPTKAWLAGAEVIHTVRTANEFGVSVGDVAIDFEQMQKRAQSVVGRVRKGLEGLIASNKITVFKGFGKLVSPREIKVMGESNEFIHCEKIILATGSEPKEIESLSFDGQQIHCSTTILQLKTLPSKMVIVGGGVIGCEFASLYRDLGVQVTVVELLPRILMNEEEDIAQVLTASFEQRGIEVLNNVSVTSMKKKAQGVSLVLSNGDCLDTDIVLVSVGRRLNTDGIGLSQLGLEIEKGGVVAVNEHMETSVDGVYAIGDITGKYWLAHVASHQGIIAADNATGKSSKMAYHAVPSVTFTRPEIATVGITLVEAKSRGLQASVARFPLQILGKSQAIHKLDGFAQIVYDGKSEAILGAQIIGQGASNLIAEMTLAINNELTLACITETVHAHPTMAEAWLESALIAEGQPLHFPPKRSNPLKREQEKDYAQAGVI